MIKKLLALPVANRASLLYLGLVAAAALYVGYDLAFVEHADASFSGVLPLALTLPGSLLTIAVLPEAAPDWVQFWLSVAVGAMVDALAVGALYHLARGRGSRWDLSGRPAGRP
ncbi:SCO4225 family membrane protein [Wenjunlia tyrosinilytica]|uniref:Uncharacterized protein n=1 Tax=Wenjunlia tyrosinilytica TaxID=1544741 RepID=A0A917ZIG5_9ACTN|nr:hypothetical protein [Wenjunlia tyrosinilytica]GGO83972.1 hypothetical protein GCM10012280_14370 [Wenjunlia tyrosinilytica]